MSEQLNELAAALAKAQGEIQTVQKDAANPFFHSRYATLAAVREAVRETFSKHGLSVVQMPEVADGHLRLRTLLLHASGQTLDCGTLSAEVDITNPQKIGSCLSYFRRYSLGAVSQAVAADEDDDAESVAHPKQPPAKTRGKAQLTGHQVVELQREINAAPTVEELASILKRDAYQLLKASGPADVYEQTSKLAKARHVLLITPPAEQAGEEEPKPF